MTLTKRRQELPSYQKEGVSWEKSEGKGTPTAPSNKQSHIKLIIITAQISQKQGSTFQNLVEVKMQLTS